jgi:hypothetical protein
MKAAPILLGMQRKLRSVPSSGRQRSNSIDIYEEDDWDIQYDLRKPNQIVIADDNNAYHVFGDSIFTAPQEDILEGQSWYSFVKNNWVQDFPQIFTHD